MGIKVKVIERGQGVTGKLDKTIVQSSSRGTEHRLNLREVFNAMAKLADGQIKNLPAGIYPETIKEVENFLISRMPGFYAEHTGTWPATTNRFLVDENMSESTVKELWTNFGRATHTGFENLNGAKDPHVWRWTIKQGIDAIITRDRRMVNAREDLGLIAVRYAYDQLHKQNIEGDRIIMPDLPLIVQIASDNHKTIDEVLEFHRDTIMAHLENRTVPYMVLTDSKCYIGPAYSDIARYDWPTLKSMVSDIDGLSRGRLASSEPKTSIVHTPHM